MRGRKGRQMGSVGRVRVRKGGIGTRFMKGTMRERMMREGMRRSVERKMRESDKGRK